MGLPDPDELANRATSRCDRSSFADLLPDRLHRVDREHEEALRRWEAGERERKLGSAEGAA